MPTSCNTSEVTWDTAWKTPGETQLSMTLEFLDAGDAVLETIDALNLTNEEYQNLIVNTLYKSKMTIVRYGVEQVYQIDAPTDNYFFADPSIVVNKFDWDLVYDENLYSSITFSWNAVCSATEYNVYVNNVLEYTGTDLTFTKSWDLGVSVNTLRVEATVTAGQGIFYSENINLYDGTVGFNINILYFSNFGPNTDMHFESNLPGNDNWYQIEGQTPVSFSSSFTISDMGNENKLNIYSDVESPTEFNFKGCRLNNVYVTKLQNPLSFRSMFEDCATDGNIRFVPSVDTSTVTDVSRFWYNNGDALYNNPETPQDYIEPLFDTSGVTDFSSMYEGVYSNWTNAHTWDISSATNISRMFYNFELLVNTPEWDFSGNTINVSSMFNGCTDLVDMRISNYFTSSSLVGFFEGCSSLVNFNLPETLGTSLASTFKGCLSIVEMPMIDTSVITDFTETWHGCSSLTKFPILDYSAATTMGLTFKDCSSLERLDRFDSNNVTNYNSIFDGCSSLICIQYITTIHANPATVNMFRYCVSLTAPDAGEQTTIEGGASWTNPNPCINFLPDPITDFDASDGEPEKITFTWTDDIYSDSYSLYKDDVFVTSDISSGFWSYAGDETVNSYKLKQINSNGDVYSNNNTGYGKAFLTPIADFAQHYDYIGKIRFTWTNDPTADSYDLYRENVLVESNINQNSFYITSDDIPVDFKIVSTNSHGSEDSNIIQANSVQAINNDIDFSLDSSIPDGNEFYFIIEGGNCKIQIDDDRIEEFGPGEHSAVNELYSTQNYGTIELGAGVTRFKFGKNLNNNHTIIDNRYTDITLNNTSQLTNGEGMFYYLNNLVTLISTNVNNFDGFTTLRLLFGNCKSMNTVPEINSINCLNFRYMFHNCDDMIQIPYINTSNANDISYMYTGCNNLTCVTSVDSTNINNNYNSSFIFYECYNLSSPNSQIIDDIEDSESGGLNYNTPCP